MVDVVDFYHGPEPNLRFEEKFSIKFSKRQINGIKKRQNIEMLRKRTVSFDACVKPKILGIESSAAMVVSRSTQPLTGHCALDSRHLTGVAGTRQPFFCSILSL